MLYLFSTIVLNLECFFKKLRGRLHGGKGQEKKVVPFEITIARHRQLIKRRKFAV